MKKIILYTFLFCFAFACKKPEPLPVQESEDPVFSASFVVDGEAQKIEAGKNDYLMNTTWLQDSANIYRLMGGFEQSSVSTNKGYALKIIFNEKALAHNASLNTDSAFKTGLRIYNDRVILAANQTVTFNPIIQGGGYTWTLTDGGTDVRRFTEVSPSPALTVGKTYSVSLLYQDPAGGPDQTHTNVFKIGSTLQTTINAVRDLTASDLKYEFSYAMSPGNSGFVTCLWEFIGGTFISTDQKPVQIFTSGPSLVKLTLTNNKTYETCVSYYQLHATYGTQSHANYTAAFQPMANTNIMSTVKVLVTDKDGLVYSSYDEIQPSTSRFEVLSVEDYIADKDGNLTKKLHVRFNCVLKNGSKSINLSNADAIIAVAYRR